jgi:hypothetical protein
VKEKEKGGHGVQNEKESKRERVEGGVCGKKEGKGRGPFQA